MTDTEVTIRRWPSLEFYHTVTLGNGTMGQMGSIDLNTANGEFYFQSYAPFDRACPSAQKLVLTAVNAEITKLGTLRKISNRMTS